MVKILGGMSCILLFTHFVMRVFLLLRLSSAQVYLGSRKGKAKGHFCEGVSILREVRRDMISLCGGITFFWWFIENSYLENENLFYCELMRVVW
jgi:hypothetical protein